MVTPGDLELQFTLMTAAARHDELRTREAITWTSDDPEDVDGAEDPPADPSAAPLTRSEALELLALSEVIARKAGYGRQLTVRSARRAGASWSQIGAALGTSKQAAWEAHSRWIDAQEEQHRSSGYEGLGPDDVTTARTLAGLPD
jgi:hypothetical protein